MAVVKRSPVMRIGEATGAIALSNLTWKLLGLLEKPLMAQRFGTSSQADAFYVASRLALSSFFFAQQVLSPCFMPLFMHMHEAGGARQAWRFASTVANILLFTSLGAATVTAFLAPGIIRATTHFTDSSTVCATGDLLRLMSPAIVILPITSFTYTLLNAHKAFLVPAAAEIVFRLITILALVTVAERMGVKGLAVGVLVGALLKLCVHIVGLGHRTARYRPVVDLGSPSIHLLGLRALPLLLGNTLAITRVSVDNLMASGLAPGSVAALFYARALVDAPIAILPKALSTSLFPFVSEMAIQGDRKQMTHTLVCSLRATAIILVPIFS